MNRKILREELLTYVREFRREPLEITLCTGSFNVSGWDFAYGILVNKANPISKLTMKQLDGIFGAERSGGWQGEVWDETVARGPEQNIRTWGQLGLSGDWKDKPIHVSGFSIKWPGAVGFANRVFKGGSKWNEKFREYMFRTDPDGTLHHPGELISADLGRDPYGIAFDGIQYSSSQTKAVALAAQDGGPYVELTIENVQNRTYPLSNDVYVYLNRERGKPVDPKLKEFLRYILSREGQEAVARDGKYLPLTDAEVVRKQLQKLE
jgi:phosphate transport system substrate-binding protein